MMEFLVASVALLWLVCILLGVLVFALARQVGVLHERVAPAGALAMNARLAVGADAPRISAPNLNGAALEVGAPAAHGTLLFFLSPDCPVCKTLLPVLKAVAAREARWLRVAFASDGATPEAHAEFIRAQNLGAFAYLLSGELGRRYGVGKLPYAVLIGENGRIAGFGLVNSREHVESLFEAKEAGVASIQDYLQRRRGRRAAKTGGSA